MKYSLVLQDYDIVYSDLHHNLYLLSVRIIMTIKLFYSCSLLLLQQLSFSDFTLLCKIKKSSLYIYVVINFIVTTTKHTRRLLVEPVCHQSAAPRCLQVETGKATEAVSLCHAVLYPSRGSPLSQPEDVFTPYELSYWHHCLLAPAKLGRRITFPHGCNQGSYNLCVSYYDLFNKIFGKKLYHQL